MIITQPHQPQFEEIGENAGRVTISGCYPGYGTTIGNALRRVLLSSLSGSAITAIKIKGVSHEFSTIDGVMEDVVQIILNLKRLRVRSFVDGPVTMTLSAKGVGPVTGAQIKTSADVEIVNPDHVIATITDKKTTLDIEFEVQQGIGYLPVEQQERGEKEIGKIAIDAIFTPIKRVKYLVENMRVGKRTDYDKVTLEIITDGSITPQDAFAQGVDILMKQFSALTGEMEVSVDENNDSTEDVVVEAEQSTEDDVSDKMADAIEDALPRPVTELTDLSTRTLHVLEENKIMTIGDIVVKSEEEILALDGMGQKGVKEIKKAIGTFGITLS